MVPAIIRDSFGNQDIVSDIIWDSLTPGAHTVTVTAFPQLITDIACNRHCYILSRLARIVTLYE